MKYTITWLLLVIGIAVGIGSLNWPAYHRMASRGVTGKATVVEVLPKAHNTVRYEYAVGGRTFQGQMQSWQPNPPLEQLGVGQSVVIYYDPQRPEASVLGDPKPILRNETISVLLAAFGMPTLIIVGWAWRASCRHANKRVTAVAANKCGAANDGRPLRLQSLRHVRPPQ
jgi:hypothetical protein